MVSKVHTSFFAACEFAFIATTFNQNKVPLLNVTFLYSSEFPYVRGQYKNGLQSRWVPVIYSLSVPNKEVGFSKSASMFAGAQLQLRLRSNDAARSLSNVSKHAASVCFSRSVILQ